MPEALWIPAAPRGAGGAHGDKVIEDSTGSGGGEPVGCGRGESVGRR